IQHDDGAECADSCTDPVAPVDDEIDPAPVPRGREFLNGGVDGRVFATDACTGQSAKQSERPKIPREPRRNGGEQVDADGDREEFLSAETIGHISKEKRTGDCAYEIGAAGETDFNG